MRSEYKLGLVVPVLNNFKGCVELFESIKTHIDWIPYVQPQWRHQVSLAAAWNRGIERAYAQECDYVLVSNDDIMLAPYCLENIVAEKQRLGDDIVMVSANNILGEIKDAYNILSYQLPEELKANPLVADHPNYSCFLIGRDFFDKVGTFDENFVPAWCEDNDSHYRIHLLGYRAVCTTAAPCVHIGGVSTHLAGNPTSAHSQAYYQKKWGSFNRNMTEAYKTPYNDPSLTPKDWIQGR